LVEGVFRSRNGTRVVPARSAQLTRKIKTLFVSADFSPNPWLTLFMAKRKNFFYSKGLRRFVLPLPQIYPRKMCITPGSTDKRGNCLKSKEYRSHF
jgi:hypothetical protein